MFTPTRLLTEEAYLAIERRAEQRHEFFPFWSRSPAGRG